MLDRLSAHILPDGITVLEQQLHTQSDAHQRLTLLPPLLAYYAFTDAHRADQLLRQFKADLSAFSYLDFEISYWLHRAIVDNHLYQFEASDRAYREAFSRLEKHGSATEIAEARIDYAGTLMNLRQTDAATEQLELAKNLLRAFPDDVLSSRLRTRHGFLTLLLGDQDQGSMLLIEAEKTFTTLPRQLTIKDYFFLTLLYTRLGDLYYNGSYFERATAYYGKCVKIAKAHRIRIRLADYYLNLGNGYMSSGDIQRASEYFKAVVDLGESEAGTNHYALALANLGNCCVNTRAYELAETYFDDAEDRLSEDSNTDTRNLFNINIWRARISAERGDELQRLANLTEAYRHAQQLQTEDASKLAHVYEKLARYYKQAENFQAAFEMMELTLQADRLHQEQVRRKSLDELDARHRSELIRQQAKLERMKATQLSLQAMQAQMNPHFVFNALNSIQSFMNDRDLKTANLSLNRFAKLMRQSLEFASLEYVLLEKEIEFLRNYLEINAVLRFDHALTYRINVAEQVEEDIIGVPALIIQPYVENAIEHGLRTTGKGHILVDMKLLDDDTLLCIVEDNGIGRARSAELQRKNAHRHAHRSRGTSITENRLELLRRQKGQALFVETVDLIGSDGVTPTGTRVEIRMPIVDML